MIKKASPTLTYKKSSKPKTLDTPTPKNDNHEQPFKFDAIEIHQPKLENKPKHAAVLKRPSDWKDSYAGVIREKSSPVKIKMTENSPAEDSRKPEISYRQTSLTSPITRKSNVSGDTLKSPVKSLLYSPPPGSKQSLIYDSQQMPLKKSCTNTGKHTQADQIQVKVKRSELTSIIRQVENDRNTFLRQLNSKYAAKIDAFMS